MKLCRFKTKQDEVRIGIVAENDSAVLDLTPAGVSQLHPLLEDDNPVARLNRLAHEKLPRIALSEIRLCAPLERQEVWAAGVTYLRSKTARMEESDFSASAYDKVYAAERPELFFKSLAEKVAATGESVGIRRDAKWNVPEPELALVMNSKEKIVGYTIGNDMSSRDIEGENLLYLPQAKIYRHSCALGPWILVGATEATAREWKIKIEIHRNGKNVLAGEASVGQIKRRFDELAGYLFRSQVFPHGAVLLTGTGIVPPDTFTLQERDGIAIEISGIGSLRNRVELV
ncbi:MAG TPA: fumarylacetoacetate hydrolase family protein [Candidatus Saccharimonadales bacterium]|nr:fumarylacetoacetate hydrolase family protein [Candidatus Saccharimonadales bacterium]